MYKIRDMFSGEEIIFLWNLSCGMMNQRILSEKFVIECC